MSKKRIISILLAVALTLSVLSVGAAADSSTAPTISVSSVTALPGATVNVNVEIKNNPGILGATLQLTYDSDLTLTDAAAGDAFSPLTLTKPGQFTSPCKFAWDGQALASGDIKDGVILTLTFKVSDTAATGKQLAVNVSYASGEIVNSSMQAVAPTIINGAVNVIDFNYGDVDNNGTINVTDLINGTLVTLTFAVNGDAEVGEAPVTISSCTVTNFNEEKLEFLTENGGLVVIKFAPGDINGDNGIDIMDVVRLAKYVCGVNVVMNTSGDVNGDGTVDIRDVVRLAKFVSGVSVELH